MEENLVKGRKRKYRVSVDPEIFFIEVYRKKGTPRRGAHKHYVWMLLIGFLTILFPMEGLEVPQAITAALCYGFLMVDFPAIFT